MRELTRKTQRRADYIRERAESTKKLAKIHRLRKSEKHARKAEMKLSPHAYGIYTPVETYGVEPLHQVIRRNDVHSLKGSKADDIRRLVLAERIIGNVYSMNINTRVHAHV